MYPTDEAFIAAAQWTLGETTTSRPGSDIMKARETLRTGLSVAIAESGGAPLDHLAVIGDAIDCVANRRGAR